MKYRVFYKDQIFPVRRLEWNDLGQVVMVTLDMEDKRKDFHIGSPVGSRIISTLMESIGYDDKNGISVFKNDILLFSDFRPKPVRYKFGSEKANIATYYMLGTELFLHSNDIANSEVIGNEWQNPEFIEYLYDCDVDYNPVIKVPRPRKVRMKMGIYNSFPEAIQANNFHFIDPMDKPLERLQCNCGWIMLKRKRSSILHCGRCHVTINPETFEVKRVN